jgi:hypothetical protein
LDIQQSAVDLVTDHGCHVLPVRAYGKHAKQPFGWLAPNGWQSASNNPDLVYRWWRQVPHAAIGVACRPSRLLVVEVDSYRSGDDQLHDLERELCRLPDTPRVISPRGGVHLYFKHPDFAAGVKLQGKLAPDVEIKSLHYVLAPPSHVRKRDVDGTIEYEGSYEWEVSLTETPAPPLPTVWLKRMIEQPPKPHAPRKRTDDWLRNLAPDRYVKDIAGLTPDRKGKVCCPSPLHNDSDPSLQLYDDHFHCFGCGAHGGIFDFWALKEIGYNIPGSLPCIFFLTVQEQLLKHYARLLGAEDEL